MNIEVGITTAPEIIWRRRADGLIEIENVTIGKEFHWQRSERQLFAGDLRIIRRNGLETAVNIVPLEEYLKSVISSEMSAMSHPELLKAHAVISRTWAMKRICDRREGLRPTAPQPGLKEGEYLMWHDADGHDDYDVCADDHCQRYQGVTRISRREVVEAVEATAGEVLTYNGRLCDARFSKCCGGAFEVFGSCWAEEEHHYLQTGLDNDRGEDLPDLTEEDVAARWIGTRPDAFCARADEKILRQVLNPYDLEKMQPGINDHYRWKKTYSVSQLRAILKKKSGMDFGQDIGLKPLRRGPSGRITLMEITGGGTRIRVGKELEIRRWLSESHLPSSAFVVHRDEDGNYILQGAGWGHGVGFCQVGGAVMSAEGNGYKDILTHYFPGAECAQVKDFYIG